MPVRLATRQQGDSQPELDGKPFDIGCFVEEIAVDLKSQCYGRLVSIGVSWPRQSCGIMLTTAVQGNLTLFKLDGTRPRCVWNLSLEPHLASNVECQY